MGRQISYRKNRFIGKESKQAIIKWIEKSQIQDGCLFRAINKGGNILEGLKSSQVNKLFKFQ